MWQWVRWDLRMGEALFVALGLLFVLVDGHGEAFPEGGIADVRHGCDVG